MTTDQRTKTLPATRRVTKKTTTKTTLSGQALVLAIKEFCGLKAHDSATKLRMDDGKKLLNVTVENDGYEDDKGHYRLDLDKPVEVEVWDTKAKKIVTKICTGLMRQRRTSQLLNEEVAEKILKKKGLYDDCTETVTVLVPDQITKLMYQGKITESEVDKMFSTSVTWAFIPQVEDK
jgi:hypothetical protein